MRTLKILLMVICIMNLSCQATRKMDADPHEQTTNTREPSLRRRERELVVRLHWEMLWNEAPQGFRVPENATARLAAYQTSDNFRYCSRDLGVCAQYELRDRQLWHRINSIKCDSEQDDMSSLLQFAGENLKTPFPNPNRTSPPVISLDGREDTLRGLLQPGGGILWTLTIDLSARNEIIEQYKQLRPAELEGLRNWLRTDLQDAGYRSITIACFMPSDPTVFVYGDRPAEYHGPIVFQVFWDKEQEEWVEAGLLEQEQNPEKFEELKAIIQAIACDTIKFR